MKIIITGTPGTGKTELSKKLSEEIKIEVVDVTNLINKIKAYKMNEEKEKEVLMPKFRNALKKELSKRKNWIIESHLLCEIRLDADFIFVLRCGRKKLLERLKRRGYNKKKMEDNVMAELLDYCYMKSKKNNIGKIIEIDTSKRGIKKCIEEMKKVVFGKKREIDSVDYSKELIDFVLKG
ncbi:MAG: AAA family ATPase [Candidatus ainarchaeum sp.]|nr:AAA family ATPase [Candidatus ainarchaeum sp.]